MANPAFTVDYTLRDFFFDRAAVIDRIGEAEAKAMSRIGAFIRRRAISSLRRRKKPAALNQTPSVHSQDPRANLRNILFGYQPTRHTVIVGPVGLNLVMQTDLGRKTVPELHEFGGTATIHEMRFRGTKTRPASHWFRRDLRRSLRPWHERRTRTARYPARPYMRRALDEEAKRGTITDAWRATI